jgi:hypothetical protein
MANTNRFYRPIGTVQLGSPTQLPFEQMMKAMGQHQQRYDIIQNASQDLADREFDFLNADTEGAAEIMQNQMALKDKVLGLGDLSRNAREATKMLSDFARENYGKFGKATAIQGSYNNFQQTLKNIQESNLPEAQKNATIARLNAQYKGVGQGEDIGFGRKKYNTFGVSDVPEYVDIAEQAMKYMKEMDPHTLEQQGIALTPDGMWIKTIAGKDVVLTQEELIRVAMPLLKNDPKLQDYLNLEKQNYAFGLSNNPGGLGALNSSAQLIHDKKVSQYSKNKAIIDEAKTALENGTVSQKQEAYNKMVDDLQLNAPKIAVDGVNGPQTKKALAMLEATIDNVNLQDPGTFDPYTPETAAEDYVNQRLSGTVGAVADLYDVHDITKKESITPNAFGLARVKADYDWRNIQRKQKLEEAAAVPLHIETPGVNNPDNPQAGTFLSVGKDGKIDVSNDHPGLKKAADQLAKAKAEYAASQISNGFYSTYGNVRSISKEGQFKLKKAYEAELAKYNEVKKQVIAGYEKDLNAYGNSIDPENKMTESERLAAYQRNLKERETALGRAFLPADKKTKDNVEAVFMDADKMAKMGNVYMVIDGKMQRFTNELAEKYGGITAASVQGMIDPTNHASGFSSGYEGTVTFGSGKKAKRYQMIYKSSSIEQDNIGFASSTGGSLRYSTEQSIDVVMYDREGNPMSNAKAIKTYDKGGSIRIEYQVPINLIRAAGGSGIQVIEYSGDNAVLKDTEFLKLNEYLGGIKIAN